MLLIIINEVHALFYCLCFYNKALLTPWIKDKQVIMKLKGGLKGKLVYGISGLLLLQGYAAYAAPIPDQTGQIIRGSTEAGRINKSLTSPSTTTPIPTEQTSVEERSVSQLSPEAAKITFELKEIRVVGAKVFTQKQLTEPYNSYLNKVVSLGDIETITQDMTTRYQKAGYVLTRVIIPPQHVENGIITLSVVEGYIDKVYVQGDVRPGTAKVLQAYGENIKAVRPLQIKVLERYALLANDLAGVSARVVLSPSQSQVGAADLTFVATQQTANGYFSIDNRGTRFLGQQQFTVGGELDSLFRPGDSTTGQYLTTGNNELTFLQASYDSPIGTNGLKFDLTGGYTRAKPGSSLTPLEIVGKSTTVNADLSYPLIRARSQNLYVHGGVGTLDSHTTILNQDLYNDHIRFFDIGMAYSRADHWLGLNEISADITQGLDVMGASNQENVSRPDAIPKFTKYNLNLSRLQGLSSKFSVLLAGQGQYTDDSLYAAEQFGFGGANFGRGYDPSEITGDRGVAGKLELRYDIGQNQLYTFYDIGEVWNLNDSTQPAKQSAASTGIGVRLHFANWATGNLEVDKPLTKKLAAEDNREPRIYFGITLSDTSNYHPDKADNTKTPSEPNFNPMPVLPAATTKQK